MYKVQDYITYFGYKQTNICSELFIQYKNTSVSYKLLHFAAAVHWRLPSPLKKNEVFTWFKSDCGREVSKKHKNHMALFHFTLFV